MSQEVRNISKMYINGDKITDDESKKIKKFIHYIEAYCAELKISETDILHNDDTFDKVYNLYKSVMYKVD